MSKQYYGDGPQARILTSVHDFLQAEQGVSMTLPIRTRVIKQWDADPAIFDKRLQMKDIILDTKESADFRILSAYVLLDDGDTELQLDAAQALVEPSKKVDPFAEYFINEFIPYIDGHKHQRCLDVADERLIVLANSTVKLAGHKRAITGEILD